MSSFTLALVAFLFIFGGAVLGLLLQPLLPEAHLSAASKDAVKLGSGLIATMAALILGLLVGSSKGTFDTVNSDVMKSSAKTIYLDRILSNYGPDAAPARAELKLALLHGLRMIWPEADPGVHAKELPEDPASVSAVLHLEKLGKLLQALQPADDSQRFLKSEALRTSAELLQSRWLLTEERRNSLPSPLLFVPLAWLAILNITYGLFAPRNHTVVAVLFACAVSVAGAIFLVLEMTTPLEGMIKVSCLPIEQALKDLGQ